MVAPVPLSMVHLVARGTILNTQVWSTGLWVRVGLAAAGPIININSYAASMETLWRDWWAVAKALNPPTVKFTGIDAYLYQAGSTVADQVANSSVGGATVGTAAQYLPTQSALVASLRTALAGSRYRGRCYIPAAGAPTGTDHQITNSVAVTQVTAFRDLIDDLNAYVSIPNNITDQRVEVRSGTGASAEPVTTVQINTELDIQRRRADSIAPTSVASIAVTP